MNLGTIDTELHRCGCKPLHINRFWRNWYLGRPLAEAKLSFPEKLQTEVPMLSSRLDTVLSECSTVESSESGARMILRAQDGELIETVLLPKGGVCVSTQVGCAVGCRFCMTGQSGLIRQLSDLEIVAQVRCAMKHQKITKVVFMGMGEPSHNLKNVLAAVDHLARFARIGYKNLVVSTVGDRRLFEELMTRSIKPALAISLHSAFDDKRRYLLPKAAKLTVKEILDFGRRYAELGGYPIQYQWTLIKGLNDGVDEIEALAGEWSGQFAVLNMIPVNVVEGSSYERPSRGTIEALQAACKAHRILLKFRDSAAQDVDGGCGQLRARALRETKEERIVLQKIDTHRKTQLSEKTEEASKEQIEVRIKAKAEEKIEAKTHGQISAKTQTKSEIKTER